MSMPMAVPGSSRDAERTSIHEPLSQSLSSDSGGKGDDRKMRRTSLQVLLTKMPAGSGSSESLNYSTPVSPGSQSWLDVSGKSPEMPSPDKGGTGGGPDSCKLTRKESYKAQRKNYRREKKRVADELLSSLKDPSVVILADWLKVRGTLKSWTKLWCVLKPGLLLLYKSPKIKSNHWVGTVLLNACQVIERPSKKDGFCFKLFHPLEQSIWAPRGPEKETLGAVVMPLPTAYLIFRASSQAAGKCWLDALELGLRCSALLVRSSSGRDSGQPVTEQSWEYEQHFTDQAEDNCMLGPLLHAFLPATPNTPHSLAQLRLPSSRFNTPSPAAGLYLASAITPVPSPTPFFHQLYAAVSCLEKDMSAAPQKRGRSYSADMGKPKSTSPLLLFGRKSLDVNLKLATPLSEVELLDFVNTDMPEEQNGSTASHELPDLAHHHHHHHHHHSASDTESDISDAGKPDDLPPDELDDEPDQTAYLENEEEEFGSAGEQVEELAEENKSLIWYLVKQVRPGMDLSKVVLPTFILEPRSFLDKLSDSYYHVDILSQAVLEEDAFTRMKSIVRWYLSGLYKKPKGLKKPYNPVLGESFRCYWKHENGSKTFYLAEQVSHHPPVSAFYVTNRQDGFCISASILAKSRFFGNSTSAILDGIAVLTLLPRGEDYTLTIPYAHCKGILMGTLTMELGGKVAIECEKTGYKTEIEFKLKPFLGGTEHTNAISGRLKLGKETLATIDGYWDGNITIRDRRTGEEQLLWCPTPEVRAKRLKRCTVPLHHQGEFESERLWQHVSAAIARDDQDAATDEKTVLEEAQRAAVKERKAKCVDWLPKYFEQDLITGQWVYKHSDLRPWDTRNDLFQYECNYVIQTKTRHKTPMIRTSSIVSVDPQTLPLLTADGRELKVGVSRRRGMDRDSGSSTPDGEDLGHSESSQSDSGRGGGHLRLQTALKPLEQLLSKHTEQLEQIQTHLRSLVRSSQRPHEPITTRTILLLVFAIGMVQAIFTWFLLDRK